jgi:hypothetical protein
MMNLGSIEARTPSGHATGYERYTEMMNLGSIEAGLGLL